MRRNSFFTQNKKDWTTSLFRYSYCTVCCCQLDVLSPSDR